MIYTLKDLCQYIHADRRRYDFTWKRYIIGRILFLEYAQVIHLLYFLRLCEFAKNNSKKSPFHFIIYILVRWNYQRLQSKHKTYININCCGPGLYIPHLGGIIVNCKSMGINCSVTSGVVIGNKAGQENRPVIGNNCYFTLGCKIVGKVSIGDNCIVCQNSVVIVDIPENSIVSGVPAKIIKHITNFSEVKI